MRKAEKIISTKKQEKCEFCNGLFWNLYYHSKTCEDRNKFIDELDKEGILTRDGFIGEDETIWVSGGLKVVLTLRKKLSTEDYLKKEKKSKNIAKEDIKLIRNLIRFENENKIRIEYDGEDDELDIKIYETTGE